MWAVFGPALFGDWSDRVGSRRLFLVVGSVLTVPAVLLAYGAPALWILALSYLLIQVSDDIATGPYSAILPELVPAQDRGRASGIMGGAMSLGQLAAVGAALSLAKQPTLLYATLCALTLAGAFAVVALVPARSIRHMRPPSRVSFLRGWLDAWQSADFRRAWLSRFFATLGFYFVIPYTQFFLQDAVDTYRLFGLRISGAEVATGVLALTLALASGLASLLVGPIVDRVGRRPVLTIGGLVAAGALSMLVPTRDFPVLWIGAFVLGLGYGAFQSAGWAQAADVLPDRASIGRDMGIWQMSISSVQIVAGAGGFVATYGNRIAPLAGYRALFIVAAISILLGVVVARRIVEPQDVEP